MSNQIPDLLSQTNMLMSELLPYIVGVNPNDVELLTIQFLQIISYLEGLLEREKRIAAFDPYGFIAETDTQNQTESLTQVFENHNFNRMFLTDPDELIPFDKTLNFDEVEKFSERIKAVKSIGTQESFASQNLPPYSRQIDLEEATLSYMANDTSFTLETLGLDPMEIAFDQKYLDKYDNFDRNICEANNRFVFFVKDSKIKMADIRRITGDRCENWGKQKLLVASSPETSDVTAVNIFINHRDGVLYSIGEEGEYASFRLLPKTTKKEPRFDDLDMLSNHKVRRPIGDSGKFTCITGRVGVIAAANFDPLENRATIFLLQAFGGEMLSQAIINTSVPIHSMLLLGTNENSKASELLTYDYEGFARNFILTDGLFCPNATEQTDQTFQIEDSLDTPQPRSPYSEAVRCPTIANQSEDSESLGDFEVVSRSGSRSTSREDLRTSREPKRGGRVRQTLRGDRPPFNHLAF